MKTVLLFGLPDGTNIAAELEKYGNYGLRVTSDESFDATTECVDVTVTPFSERAPKGSKIIAVTDPEPEALSLAAKADDFICRPLSSIELNARIMRLIAPVNAQTPQKELILGALRIDLERAYVTFRGQMIHLTLYEYKLLCLLSQNCGNVVRYKVILEELWANPIGNEILSLRVFVAALRKKLQAVSTDEVYIQTHMGEGYCMPKIDSV